MDDTPTPESAALVRDYELAVIEFNVAAATLIDRLAANKRPTDQELSAEKAARAAVVAARQRVWDTRKEIGDEKKLRCRGLLREVRRLLARDNRRDRTLVDA
jgi:hypothetical protein